MIDFDNETKKYLVREGYGPQYGARPLKRVIQRRIIDPVSQKIISGEIREGNKITVKYADSGMTIKIK